MMIEKRNNDFIFEIKKQLENLELFIAELLLMNSIFQKFNFSFFFKKMTLKTK